MRALVFRGTDGMVVEQIPEPDCGPDEVVVEVLAVGICGSDVHGYAGETGRRAPGMVMGHEVVGVVTAIGAGVQGWTRGEHVVVNPVIGCRRCAACLTGFTNRCPDRRVIGVAPEIVGAFTERIAVPASNLVLFDAATPEATVQGSLVEPLAVGLNAVRQAGVRPGSVVAVVGLGMIGLACVWAALREGAAVVYAGDVDPERVATAERIGAPGSVVAFDLRMGPLHEQLVQIGRDQADCAVDAAGLAITCRDALRATRSGGVVALVGMAAPLLELDVYELTTNEKSLIGSFCYPEETFAECAAAVASGHLDPTLFVDTVVELDQAPQTFSELASRLRSSVKTIVVPRR